MIRRVVPWASVRARVASAFTLEGWGGIAWPIGALCFICGVFLLIPPVRSLPSTRELVAFASTLWQVHATVLAFTVIVISVIVTVLADRMYRRETWELYRRHSKFFPIVVWNLSALISGGAASLLTRPASNPSHVIESIDNLVVAQSFIFFASIVLAAWLYWTTLRFLDPDHVERLSERGIKRGIRRETIADFERALERGRRLRE